MASARSLPLSAFSVSVDRSTFQRSTFFSPLSTRLEDGSRKFHRCLIQRSCVKAMVQQAVQQGPSVAYAREMERLSAKESLLLALEEAGGFSTLVGGKMTDMQRIDVSERITSLERLNPTPQPAKSSYLKGRWNVNWFDSSGPGVFAAQFIFERLALAVASLSRLDVLIKEESAEITANMTVLNSIQTKVVLSSKLSVEGPLRIKEEYVEGVIESPVLSREAVPEEIKSLLGQATYTVQQLPTPIRDAVSDGFSMTEKLKGMLGQATSTIQQLPVPIRDAVFGGIRVPLGGAFTRMFMVSYLDDEILIIRDSTGKPEVLTRQVLDSSSGSDQLAAESES